MKEKQYHVKFAVFNEAGEYWEGGQKLCFPPIMVHFGINLKHAYLFGHKVKPSIEKLVKYENENRGRSYRIEEV